MGGILMPLILDGSNPISQAGGGTGAAAMPAFSAFRGTSSQAITTGVETKVQLNAEDFDTASAFDSTTNFRFVPATAGYYQLDGTIQLTGTLITDGYCVIYKNGTVFKYGSRLVAATGVGTTNSSVSALVFLNGTTDFVELFAFASATTPLVAFGSASSFFSGCLSRGI